MNRCLKLCIFLVPLALVGAGQTSSRPRVLRSVAPEKSRDSALETALRRELGSDAFSYAYNFVNLKGAEAREVLVYLPGSDYCGSGGCTSLVLEKHALEYRLISRLSLTRAPIIVSSHRTNGWNDLIVFVSGGGIHGGYYSVLAFDGQKYPENPTTAPATRLRRGVTGIAYLSGADKAERDIVVSPR